ncbi:hypothetical protein KIN20_020415 [Parelaphostrongylus tenuis]|uniref:Uncharacterized protein n=1 Tax=Parelaphostrongylus tenuis TaxID=148309 RepID=A0AAD5N5W8_PARTN|nr:hypothetical protein KIN20_020415 [Parelaphostrongylus tenuis]
MKEERLSKALRMIRLIPGSRLSKVLFEHEKTLIVNRSNIAESTSPSQERSAEVRNIKNHGQLSFLGLCDGLSRYLPHRKDAFGLHKRKRQN